MKKNLVKLLICFFVCILVGCSDDNVPYVEVETENPNYENSVSEKTKQDVTEDASAVTPKASAGNVVFDNLSSEEKRKLNVFFSNFAEADFDEYDCNHIEAKDLYEFAFIHNRVNGTSEEEYNMFTSSYFEYVMGIRVQVVDKIIDKYFGVSVPFEDTVSINEYGRYCGWAFKNGYMYTEAASGESYDRCAVATTLVDNGDGTYLAKYDKYSAAPEMMNKKYYSYTPEQANSDPDLQYCNSYIAVIKPCVVDGKETWQLLELKKE